MNQLWRSLGIAGGLLGAAIGGVVVTNVRKRREIDKENSLEPSDPFAEEPFFQHTGGHRSTVVADDGVPLSVVEYGSAASGTPELTVVFVHGYTLNKKSWYFQRRALAQQTDIRMRLVCYDQRSHGESGRSSRETATIEQLGRDLEAVLRAVAPTGPLMLVGHSMGGMTIMALAEQRPQLFADRVCGVAFIGTAAGKVGSAGLPRPVLSRYNPVIFGLGKLAGWQPEIVEHIRRSGNQLTKNLLQYFSFGNKAVHPALVDALNEMISHTPVEVMIDFLNTLETHNRYAALAGLRHCRALVICGEADRFIPFTHSQAIAAELPDATLVRVAGAGHLVQFEQADLVSHHLFELAQHCVQK